jgi:riboflavin kinase/FMN adenylyltransferase
VIVERLVMNGKELDRGLLPQKVVAAIGVFDGLHLGHQALLLEAKRVGDAARSPVLLMTFHPHPRMLTGDPEGHDRLLTPQEEKAYLSEDSGVFYFLSLNFSKELAATSPEDFVRDYLVRGVRAAHVVCGFNFSFGYRGKGTPADLQRWGLEEGFGVTVLPPFEMGGETVSSTRVRDALKAGNVSLAASYLGRPYCLYGRVERGDGRGHRIGFATSNITIPEDKVLPATGVYAAYARFYDDDRIVSLPSVVNIGTRPTFGGEGVRVECHIPGFDGTLYGKFMQVFFLERIRNERRFPDASSLREKVRSDIGFLRSGMGPEGAWRKPGSFTLPGGYDRMLQANLP